MNAVSENSESLTQEIMKKWKGIITGQWVWTCRLKTVAFYGVTTMSAWFNICYHTATMLRSFDFRFERPGPGSHRFRLLNTKWQDLQSLLLWPFTSCGLSYLKVRMNNNLRKVLAILWVTFGKLNTTRFHNKTVDRYRQLKYAVAIWPVTGQGHWQH